MLLFHGCLLLQFDLAWIERLLPMPSSQPEYRQGRAHADFVVNLALPLTTVKEALRRAWGALRPWELELAGPIQRLVQERYGRPDWRLRR
jgi:lipoate-protein ligase A